MTGGAVLPVVVNPAGVVGKARAIPPVVLRLGVANLAYAVMRGVAVRKRAGAGIPGELNRDGGKVGRPEPSPYAGQVIRAVRLVAAKAVCPLVGGLGVAVLAEPVALGRGSQILVVQGYVNVRRRGLLRPESYRARLLVVHVLGRADQVRLLRTHIGRLGRYGRGPVDHGRQAAVVRPAAVG